MRHSREPGRQPCDWQRIKVEYLADANASCLEIVYSRGCGFCTLLNEMHRQVVPPFLVSSGERAAGFFIFRGPLSVAQKTEKVRNFLQKSKTIDLIGNKCYYTRGDKSGRMREGKWSMCRPVFNNTSHGVGPHPVSTAKPWTR